jgi:hypothetical protein
MNIYESEQARYQLLFEQASKTYNTLSWTRLALIGIVLIAAFQYYKTGGDLYWVTGLVCLVIFFVLVNKHDAVGRKKNFYRQLVKVNAHEIAAKKGDFSNFEAGEKYVDPHHAYTFDLDIFGANSFYQHLNRTANVVGADKLAQYFLRNPAKTEIYETQEAIRDLAEKLEWRQAYLASGQLHPDQQAAYQQLLHWAAQPVKRTGLAWRILWVLMTVVTVGVGLVCLLNPTIDLLKLLQYLALINLAIVTAHSKKIKTELQHLNSIYKIVAQYGFLLRSIENGIFTSKKISAIQADLRTEDIAASKAILELSRLVSRLESIQNMIGAVVFNSFFIYHVHVLLALEKWKLRHAPNIKKWIDSVGEMEALSSLAHFSYNNPDFIFPVILEEVGLKMSEMGHPMIPKEKRVCNSIQFEKPGFVILTGSNMSGKSTFLRTIGLNLLLAKIGAPVCAETGETFPFDIFVCMKLSDSLHDNESYFYAELKRLKGIIDHLESGPPGFVLLDEVLRGTNSNDKLSGTLGLIETMVKIKATGLLATHDLKVCELTTTYPEHLRNMCFEVEMTSDNLYFDYRLRDGVCVNKSASFLMKKMGVIS